MFAKNDEEKRNRLWKTAISVSTLVIILIAVFFVIKLFTSNPLEGTWVREDSDLMLTISGEDQAVVQWPEEFESADVKSFGRVQRRYRYESDHSAYRCCRIAESSRGVRCRYSQTGYCTAEAGRYV